MNHGCDEHDSASETTRAWARVQPCDGNAFQGTYRNLKYAKGENAMKHKYSGCKSLFMSWGFAIAALTLMVLPFGPAFAESSKLKETGSVTINQAQVAFIFSGNVGGGKLQYQGKTYPFTIGGLGVGGFGISSIEATGTIYNLFKLSDFAGAYGQARAGLVVGTLSAGTLWLENHQGVYMKLAAKRTGIMLSLGLDGILIGFD